ncbi:hypothetical protein H8D36_04625 [archaeon]|nr:hypothetical protein [archaeon]
MADDLSALAVTYSGRSLIVGMTPDENPFMGYALTGRSPPSQARRLGPKSDDGMLMIRTRVTNEQELQEGNPLLLIYPALVGIDNLLIGSNGAQTGLIMNHAAQLLSDGTLDQHFPTLLQDCFAKPVLEYDKKNDRQIDITTFEPDDPIYTPRISAITYKGNAIMHIVTNQDGQRSDSYYEFQLEPGKGKLLSTYKGDNEKPIVLPFEGEPRDVTITSLDVDCLANSIFAAIKGGEKPGENFQVSAAVMKHWHGGNHLTIRNRF